MRGSRENKKIKFEEKDEIETQEIEVNTKFSKWSKFLSIISTYPLIVLCIYLVTIAALIVTIVFHFVEQENRELVYAVNPIRTEILVAGKTTGLEVSFYEQNIGSNNVTAVQVAIWNSGDLSIRPENILKEITIVLDPPVPILEASIVKHYRESEITRLELVGTQDDLNTQKELNQGKVKITFNILEKDDGATIQLIYLGSINIDISVDGIIEGCGNVKKVEPGINIKSPTEQLQSSQEGRWVYIFFGFVIVFIMGYEIRNTYKSFKNRKKSGVKSTLIILIPAFVLLGMIIIYIIGFISSFHTIGPPFGF